MQAIRVAYARNIASSYSPFSHDYVGALLKQYNYIFKFITKRAGELLFKYHRAYSKLKLVAAEKNNGVGQQLSLAHPQKYAKEWCWINLKPGMEGVNYSRDWSGGIYTLGQQLSLIFSGHIASRACQGKLLT